MKQLYIKPEVSLVLGEPTNILSGSNTNKWQTQIGDGGSNTQVGDNEPDPGNEAKQFSDFQFENNWEFASNWDFENNWEFKSN